MTPEQIRTWRKLHGLTQKRLSELLATPKRTIENWEGGTRTPPKYLNRALRDVAREIATVDQSTLTP